MYRTMTDQIEIDMNMDMSLMFQTLPRSIDPTSTTSTVVKCVHSPASEGETRRTENTSVESLSDDQDERCVEQDIRILLELPVHVNARARASSCSSESDGSVSSMSSDDDDTPRAIFPKHWQKSAKVTKRRRPFPKTSMKPQSFQSSDDESEEGTRDASRSSTSGNTYERTLRKREGIKPTPPDSNIARRRLFAGCMNHDNNKPVQRSNSCFGPVSSPMMMLSRRNACSDSALVVKRSPSCLRPSKYSGDDASRHFDRNQSVTFAQSASMVKYEIPQEQWAASGWSSYFY